MSAIVCLGWGSLIWDARGLPVNGDWKLDGPSLPLEFARQSADGRMTLVIVGIEHHVSTLWAEMDVSSLSQAVDALANREGVKNPSVIGRWPNTTDKNYERTDVISAWATRMQIRGVVWTALQPGMKEQRGAIPSLNDLTAYISQLDNETLDQTKKYIRNAPAQIVTPYREALMSACETSGKERL